MAMQTALSGTLTMIWDSWYFFLNWLNPVVQKVETLSVTVTLILFGILFYVAFRFFILDRLLKDRLGGDDSSGMSFMRKASVVLAVSFAFLGTNLGWVPAVAGLFGLFFLIIAIVFAVIVWLGIWGMAKRSAAEYTAISGEAEKVAGAGRLLAAEGRQSLYEADQTISGIKDMESEESEMANKVFALAGYNKSYAERFEQFRNIIQKAKSYVNNPDMSQKYATYVQQAFDTLKTMNPTSWRTLYDGLSKRRKTSQRFTNRFGRRAPVFGVQAKLVRDLRKQSNEARRLANELSRDREQNAARIIAADKTALDRAIIELERDLNELVGIEKYDDWAFKQFKTAHETEEREKKAEFSDIRMAVGRYRAAATEGNPAKMLAALNSAESNAGKVIATLTRVKDHDTTVATLENQYRLKLRNIETRIANARALLVRIDNALKSTSAASSQAVGQKAQHIQRVVKNKARAGGGNPSKYKGKIPSNWMK
ncbi:MAG: hypothetical protein PHC66_03815 [Candidatus Nanoarchaeia archaeon]|nr:hypothetical protein [Candidatus Nanoarchaeia archaeon]MDD5239222.1 hypothetical protein [Candidatus Nanoarchaeia archaeon]